MQRIIIDGYNLIHADEGLRRRAGKDLEGARKHLVGKLRRYLRGRKLQITVVFDGRGRLAETETIVPGKLQLVYSATPGTADDLIVSTLEQSSSPKAYIVVTSDMAHIGRAASALGAEVVGSKRFLERLEECPPKPSHGDKEKPEPEDEDTEYWLRKFSRDRRKPSEE